VDGGSTLSGDIHKRHNADEMISQFRGSVDGRGRSLEAIRHGCVGRDRRIIVSRCTPGAAIRKAAGDTRLRGAVNQPAATASERSTGSDGQVSSQGRDTTDRAAERRFDNDGDATRGSSAGEDGLASLQDPASTGIPEGVTRCENIVDGPIDSSTVRSGTRDVNYSRLRLRRLKRRERKETC